MSPFSHYLYELRMRREIRQSELADLLGYEQSYISALEIGVKGPPTPEFIERLIAALRMSEGEQQELRSIAEASQRKLALNGDCSPDVYWMLKELRDQVNELHPLQIKMIRDALDLRGVFAEPAPKLNRRIKRRSKVEVNM